MIKGAPCGACDHNFATGNTPAAPADPSGMTVGDKNVIAGDVVGSQEIIKVAGAATIVKNEDETKKMVKCHVCGRNIPISQSRTCPVCGETTCESCFDASRNACAECVKRKTADRENEYANAFREALEDGVMTLAKRRELNTLRKKLGIGEERASALEESIRRGAKTEKDCADLSSYVRLSLQKALDILYNAGDAQKAYDELLPIYRRHPDNEEVLIGFLNAAIKVNPEEAFSIVRQNQADVAGLHLVCIDYDLANGDLTSADERLNAATRLWPDNLLVACRKILCLIYMYDKLQDGRFLKQAEELLSSLPEPQGKLESSWACRVRNAVRAALGENFTKVSRDYCRENDLYFAVASDDGRDPDEMYRQALEVRDSDIERYVELLNELAKWNHADAQCSLGFCYENGEGVAQNYAEAIKWYRKSAEQGNAYAQNNLGGYYENGIGVAQDQTEAANWYRKAAEHGDSCAQFKLGVCYAKGQGVEQNYVKAAEWWRKAAEQNHAEAQYNLGVCYYNGQGVTQDHEEAVKWHRKAAEQNHAEAQCMLGKCYLHGDGVEKDPDEAAGWFRKAAEKGNPEAQYLLGECYLHGHGVEEDPKEATGWFQKATDGGYAEAKPKLAEAHYRLGEWLLSEKPGAAVGWFQKAVDAGYDGAKRKLAEAQYRFGEWLLSEKPGAAVGWFQKAADGGYDEAKPKLAEAKRKEAEEQYKCGLEAFHSPCGFKEDNLVKAAKCFEKSGIDIRRRPEDFIKDATSNIREHAIYFILLVIIFVPSVFWCIAEYGSERNQGDNLSILYLISLLISFGSGALISGIVLMLIFDEIPDYFGAKIRYRKLIKMMKYGDRQ